MLLDFGPHAVSNAPRPLVGRDHHDLGHIERPFFGVMVTDRKPPHPQGTDHIDHVSGGKDTAVQRHGGVEYLEGRSQFIDSLGGAVEPGIGIGTAEEVGIVIRQ